MPFTPFSMARAFIRFAFGLALCGLASCGGNEADNSPAGPRDADCSITDVPNDTSSLPAQSIEVELTKWFEDRTAAITLTYDHGCRWMNDHEKLIQRIIREENVPLDFDFTNSDLLPYRRAYYLDTLIPSGVQVFGHGYDHPNSDTLTEEEAYDNFRRCYDDMRSAGITPISYAYPTGAALKASTRRALARSGFLSGRLFSGDDHAVPYIAPGNRVSPDDWFGLPSLVMWRAGDPTMPDPRYVNNTADLIPYLDGAIALRAWLITTYHEIKDGPGSTYSVADFRNDIAAIKGRDFWRASFNDVTLYLHERERATVATEQERGEDGALRGVRITISDGLPNDLFNHPLTARLTLPESWIGRDIEIVRDGVSRRVVRVESTTPLIPLLPDERSSVIRLIL